MQGSCARTHPHEGVTSQHNQVNLNGCRTHFVPVHACIKACMNTHL